MWRAPAAPVAIVCLLLGSSVLHSTPFDPFAFFAPTVQLDDENRSRLERGAVAVQILPAEGHELGVLTAGSTTATPAAVVQAVSNIASLKKSHAVPEVGRFSRRPKLQDLNALSLDPDDLDAIKACRPDDCDLKLAGTEIARLQHAIQASGPNWKPAVEQAFRQVVMDRVVAYLRGGADAMPPSDTGDTRDRNAVFADLVQHTAFLPEHAPRVVAFLERFPHGRARGITSFLYWSKETVAPKPIISVTHVAIDRQRGRNMPGALIVSREVFSTRYTSGAVAVTALVGGSGSRARYLVYVNRTWIDPLHAIWRPFIEHRVKNDAPKVFDEARRRVEARESMARGRASLRQRNDRAAAVDHPAPPGGR